MTANTQSQGAPDGIVLVHADAVEDQPWRNGGGKTRELLTWPAGSDWRLRISRADIEVDGPFSPYAQVQRWFTVLQGAGVVLSFAERRCELRPGTAPLCFDGATPPGCRLVDGPTQDLNLMLRGGSGVMRAVDPSVAWSEPLGMRGLYAAAAGTWCAAQQTLQLPAHTLLWQQHTDDAPWTFEPTLAGDTAQAWWLGFSPDLGRSPEQ
ncbi:MAG: HutD family protein [Burkholderiaceae bacterium]